MRGITMKSLKEYFVEVEKNILAEAEQLTIEPAKQSTQVLKKGNDVIGTVTNPALAATIKSAIGKGEMSLAGKEIKEEQLDEKAPPGMEDVVLSLKKKFPGEEGRAYAIAWSMYNKKHGKKNEAEIPHSGPDFGAGLGAGRKDNMLEAKPDFLDLDKDGNKKEPMKKAAADKKKKKVDEAMNTLEAAYHEGKSHGLSKSNYACRYNEGSEEHKRYHEGFKEGLDECYGLMPNRGLVVSETPVPATVPGMADQAEKEMGEGNAFTGKLASTPKGGSFELDGKSFKDTSNLEEFAFESLDKQLEDLLKEDAEPVAEGLSVSMSTGQQGSPDSVSVTGTDDEAAKLLSFIKQVGLGGMGADKPEMTHGEPVVAVASDYGAPKFSGHDDMASLMKKVGADDDHKHEGKVCETHGVVESSCGCGESKEMVDEVESENQMEYQVAEDDGEGNIEADEQGAQIDAALAVGSENEKAVHEDGMESSPEAAGAVAAADAAEEEEEAMSESSFLNLYKKLSLLSEESTKKEDEKAEKAGKKVTKDIEYDDKKDKKEEKLDEWANDAGKDGTQTTFERDIEFMTKVISGGLNKPKSTGQQTIPVLAGDKDRLGDEDFAEWKKLAGLGK